MADQEEEDLRMALRMSMQNSPPEPKRSKPRDSIAGGAPAEESPEIKSRRLQRELRAAAAEKRMLATKKDSASSLVSGPVVSGAESISVQKDKEKEKEREISVKDLNLGKELTEAEADQLFSMVFGAEVSRGILSQWSNQGIRYALRFGFRRFLNINVIKNSWHKGYPNSRLLVLMVEQFDYFVDICDGWVGMLNVLAHLVHILESLDS